MSRYLGRFGLVMGLLVTAALAGMTQASNTHRAELRAGPQTQRLSSARALRQAGERTQRLILRSYDALSRLGR